MPVGKAISQCLTTTKLKLIAETMALIDKFAFISNYYNKIIKLHLESKTGYIVLIAYVSARITTSIRKLKAE